MDTIDRKRLEEFQRYDRSGSLLRSILDVFLQVTPRTVAEMKRAAEREDLVAVLKYTHGLKSSSAHAGAIRMSSYCREFEHRFGDATDWNTDAAEEVERIVAEHALVMTRLKEIRAEPLVS